MPKSPARRAILLAALALAGCASTTGLPHSDTARLAAYERAVPCCTDPALLGFVDLPATGVVDVTIGPGSQLFDFQSGRSFLAAFRLPERSGPYRVRVKSFFEGPAGPDGFVFYPSVALMDEWFIVSRVSGLDNLRLDPGLAAPDGEAGLVVTIPLDSAQARERYLVVFTPAALLGGAPEERREGDVLTAAATAFMAQRGQAMVEPSPFGRLRVTVISELEPPAAAAREKTP
jgi:maltose operon protein